MKTKILLGNEAIALGMVESGCRFLYSYPGTPASEILPSFIHSGRQAEAPVYAHWSVNEKIALESAFTVAATGLRSAAVMKQVGLNVAADPLLSGAYLGVEGGLVLVSADDPGPYSSQTEQDSRLYAFMAKIPVFDPADPAEARKMVGRAFALAEQYRLPVMLRPTAALCHARQNLPADRPAADQGRRQPVFRKEPARWAATPRRRFVLHQQLNQKLAAIEDEEQFRFYSSRGADRRLAIVASGFAWSLTADLLHAHPRWQEQTVLIKVDLPYPLHRDSCRDLLADFSRVLVIEESSPVIEMQLGSRRQVAGRRDGTIPGAGELTPDLLAAIVAQQLENRRPEPPARPTSPPRRPSLCPGCPHRASFYTLKNTLKDGIYTGDIGCYTLGLNLGALDTCLCMGASITQAAAFYQAYHRSGVAPPALAAVIGDSTFYHSGIPALINARQEDSRFVLLLLDNETTAMTGNQPTPAGGGRADGSRGPALPLEQVIKGCGIEFLAVVDPYEPEKLAEQLRAAHDFTRAPAGGIAVVIARHPCMMDAAARNRARRYRVEISDECTACGTCREEFECPALLAGDDGRVHVDPLTCVGCGLCLPVCPFGAIVGTPMVNLEDPDDAE